MRVLIVGAGGREHAMAWHCARAAHIEQVLVAPGNAGTNEEPNTRNVDVAADDVAKIVELAQKEAIDLVIVGPEQPLVAGLVDRCKVAGIPCFGPTANGAQLEGSKAFSKSFMIRHGIPTAGWARFTNFAAAETHIRERGAPCVVKADGLAAGKGVVVAETEQQAIDAARDMLVHSQFGGASAEIIIEDFLAGEEASLIAITDGHTVVPLASSQDHKARDEGDRGPNTGGMGAYSPAPILSGEIAERAVQEVLQPTLDGLRDDGIDYIGFIYAGLMIDADGQSKVLEFNCRLGDPETQPILRRLKTPLDLLCRAALNRRLHELAIEWHDDPCVGVVMAAEGYPAKARTGDAISGIGDADALSGVKVFHAGTRQVQGQSQTAGGRVLCVTATGSSVTDAAANAYAGVAAINWPGCYCRRDIAWRAIERERRD